jgi:ribosomal protein S27E
MNELDFARNQCPHCGTAIQTGSRAVLDLVTCHNCGRELAFHWSASSTIYFDISGNRTPICEGVVELGPIAMMGRIVHFGLGKAPRDPNLPERATFVRPPLQGLGAVVIASFENSTRFWLVADATGTLYEADQFAIRLISENETQDTNNGES